MIKIEAIKEHIAKVLQIDIEDIDISEPKRKNHGDLSTNIALKIGKSKSQSPMELCEIIKKEIDKIHYINKVEILKPGFINIFIKEENKIITYFKKLDTIELPIMKREKINMYSQNETIDKCKNKLRDFRTLIYQDTLGTLLSNLGQDVSNITNIEIDKEIREYFCNIIFQDKDRDNFTKDSKEIKANNLHIENAQLNTKMNLEELLKRLPIDRLKMDMIYSDVNEQAVVEIMDDKLLWLAYPVRRIEIINTRIQREKVELISKEDMRVDELSEEMQILLKKLSEFASPLEQSKNLVSLTPVVEYMLDITNDFYKINNNTLIRDLTIGELSRILRIYNYYRNIMKLFFEILNINIADVYS